MSKMSIFSYFLPFSDPGNWFGQYNIEFSPAALFHVYFLQRISLHSNILSLFVKN